MVYATDHEPYSRDWRERAPTFSGQDRGHTEFLADLVIHDSQYVASDFPAKAGWGHSPVEYAVTMAAAARVRRLALFHHDPLRSDEDVDALVDGARRGPRRRQPARSRGRHRRRPRAAVLAEVRPRVDPSVAPAHGLDALRRLRVLDTEPEERFDRITRLAAEMFEVVDRALTDDRFADNPIVAGIPYVRFYAGAPIAVGDGHRVGTLCLIDHRPRELTARELRALRELADQVEAEFANQAR